MYPEIFSALKGKVEICCKLSLASNFNSDTDNDRVYAEIINEAIVTITNQDSCR